jgi:hypothetical protein
VDTARLALAVLRGEDTNPRPTQVPRAADVAPFTAVILMALNHTMARKMGFVMHAERWR